LCQRIKNHTELLAGKLMANEISEKLWIHLIVNFITKLLLVTEKDTILVVYDRLSKMANFIAITERTIAEELVCLFRDNMWKLYKLSESMISDREPQFAAKLMRELNIILEIKIRLSIVFYPQTDGQTEQIN